MRTGRDKMEKKIKPQLIIPDIDFRADLTDLPRDQK